MATARKLEEQAAAEIGPEAEEELSESIAERRA